MVTLTTPSYEEFRATVEQVNGEPIAEDWIKASWAAMLLWHGGAHYTELNGKPHPTRLTITWKWDNGQQTVNVFTGV
jgi:hypothetical protein